MVTEYLNIKSFIPRWEFWEKKNDWNCNWLLCRLGLWLGLFVEVWWFWWCVVSVSVVGSTYHINPETVTGIHSRATICSSRKKGKGEGEDVVVVVGITSVRQVITGGQMITWCRCSQLLISLSFSAAPLCLSLHATARLDIERDMQKKIRYISTGSFL